MRRALLAFALLAAGAVGQPWSRAEAQTWLTEPAQLLPSGNAAWGTPALDGPGRRLFVPRGADGLLVWSIESRQAVTVADSRGALAVVLAPDAGRAYAAMADGTVLAIDLASLKPLGRTDAGIGDVADGVYDPATQRVYLISGPRPERTAWAMLDAATGEVLGRAEFNSKAMDAPAIGENGVIFAAMRDRNLLQQIDPKDMAQQKTWRLGDCVSPAATAWDAAARRVLIACGGEKPVFVALDPAAGVVATLPIGRGAEGIVVDAGRHLIVTANGADGTMSVIRQDGPNDYVLVETVATRPMARGLVFDAASGRLFSITAAYSQPAPGPDGKPQPPVFHPGSFAILSWTAN